MTQETTPFSIETIHLTFKTLRLGTERNRNFGKGRNNRSISPWASPIAIVPKKSAPGEPPRRRMCVDYQKINKLQPEVTKADGGKGCISLTPLPKIDELYAKLLKATKFFLVWTSDQDTITSA